MSVRPENEHSWKRLLEKCETARVPILPAAIGLFACLLVALFALTTPIGRDSALNLEWAESIGTTLKFQMTEVPHYIYPPYLTNGGPLLYAGGLGYALTHSVDGAIALGIVSGFAVLVVGLILLDPWLSAVALALLFVWPIFRFLSTAFLAEFWATGLTLIGLAFFARAQSAPTIAKLFADRRAWIAFVLFSLAICSKMVVCFAVCGVIFATVFARERPSDVAGAVLNGLRALAVTAVCCSIVGILFFLEFGFAIVQAVRSVQALSTIPASFLTWLNGMFYLTSVGQHARVVTFAGQFNRFSNSDLLIVIIAAALILVLRRPSYLLLVFFCALLWLHFAMEERETLPDFLTVLVLGLHEMLAIIGGIAQRRRLPAAPLKMIALAGILVFVTYKTPGLGAPVTDPDRRYGAYLTNGYMHYSPEMVQDFKAHAYILTGGIALPQIDASWGLTFYDRFAPQNAHLWNEDDVLLFDVAQFPKTTVADNCSSVIRAEGDLVLCRPRKDVPLAYEPVVMPPGQRRTVDLSRQSWTAIAAFHRASDGPHRSPEYRFVGTEAISGDPSKAVTLAVAVQPGKAYVFSARVDPSRLAGDRDFDLTIYDASTSYAIAFWPAGPPGGYTLTPWVCPPGVHHVILGMGMTASASPNEQALTFAEPALTEIETPRTP